MIDIHPEHARAVLGEIALGLILIDGEERVTWINDHAAELLGAEAASLVGQPVEELHVPYAAPGDGTQVQLDGAMIGISQRYDHPAGRGAILMILERGHALVWFLNALSSGVPATVAASGLLSRSAVTHRLEAEVSRSRRYANPLSCIGVTAADSGAAAVGAVARALKGQLRWVDQLGQWTDDVLLVVLPETDEAAVAVLVDKLRDSLAEVGAAEGARLAVGCATWRRGESAEQLVARALAASVSAAAPLARENA